MYRKSMREALQEARAYRDPIDEGITGNIQKAITIAKKMGGGGHPFAAAALVEGELADVKSTVLNLMSTYINSKK